MTQTTTRKVTEQYVMKKSLSFIASLPLSDNPETNRENLRIAIQTARNVIDEEF